MIEWLTVTARQRYHKSPLQKVAYIIIILQIAFPMGLHSISCLKPYTFYSSHIQQLKQSSSAWEAAFVHLLILCMATIKQRKFISWMSAKSNLERKNMPQWLFQSSLVVASNNCMRSLLCNIYMGPTRHPRCIPLSSYSLHFPWWLDCQFLRRLHFTSWVY